MCLHVPVCLFVNLYVFVCIFVCPFVHMYVCLLIGLSICLLICLSLCVCLLICLLVCVSFCLVVVSPLLSVMHYTWLHSLTEQINTLVSSLKVHKTISKPWNTQTTYFPWQYFIAFDNKNVYFSLPVLIITKKRFNYSIYNVFINMYNRNRLYCQCLFSRGMVSHSIW